MARKGNKEVEKAIKVVDEMSMNKEERELYEARLKGEFNYNTAIHIAKEEGEKKKQLEIAKRLLSKKMPIEEIIEITGLSEKQMKELEKESM